MAGKGDVRALTEALKRTPQALNFVNEHCSNWTPLLAAVGSGHLDALRLLVQCGADVTVQDNCGETAFHWLAKSDRPLGEVYEAALLLLTSGADIDATNKDHAAALHLAAANNRVEAIRALLALGARADVRDNYYGCTPLEVAQELLEATANTNARKLLDDAAKTKAEARLELRQLHAELVPQKLK